MDWRIDWTEPALADLASIVRFIAQDNREAAERVGYRIVDHVGILKRFPEIGPIFRRRQTRQCSTNYLPPIQDLLSRSHGNATC
jgi:plasmid stabilization system protein ParE